jgi:hypothetical protein
MSDEIEIGKLEALAAWHRLNAERAGSTWVWDARLRTAEDLERRAAEQRARALHTTSPGATRGNRGNPRPTTLQESPDKHRNSDTTPLTNPRTR